MAPAIRPAFSCSAPSSVEIDCAVACVKLSGRAPYLSWLASSVAVVWLKLPVISVLPPGIAPLIVGAETTRPSRVIADLVADVGGGVGRPRASSPWCRSRALTTHSPVVGAGAGAGVGDVGALDDRRARAGTWPCRRRCRSRRSRRAGRPSPGRLLVAGQRGVLRRSPASWVTGGRVRVRRGVGPRRGAEASPPGPTVGVAARRRGRGGRGDARVLRAVAPRRRRSGAAARRRAAAGRRGGRRGRRSTGRNRSCAVAPSWRAWSPLSPGTEMTMFELPSVTTSASATPRPLTRCSMIWRASSRSAWRAALPFGVLAVSVTVVPPREVQAELRRPAGAGEEDQGVQDGDDQQERAEVVARRAASGWPSVVPRLRGPSVGRTAGRPGRRLVPRSSPEACRAARLGRLADLEDRLPGEGDDHAGRDLEVDGALTEAGDVPCMPAGGHHRGADGRASPAAPAPGPASACAAGPGSTNSRTRQGEEDEREVLLHDRCASLPRVLLRGGVRARDGPARVRRLPGACTARRRPGGTRTAAAGRVARQRSRSLGVEQRL